jgi:hypothetical protein
MRDFVILHAAADAAAAAALEHALGGRGAVGCVIRPGVPTGNFGPQFTLIALWSQNAYREGIAPAMERMLAGRSRASALVRLDNAALPVTLSALTPLQMALGRDGYVPLGAALMANTHVAVDVAPRKAKIDARKAMNVAATAATAVFSFAGSAVLAGMTPAAGNLAWASSDDAVEPNVIVETAPVRGPITLPDVTALATPDLDPILARAEKIMAQAQAVANKPAVQARFEMVQRVAASNIDLRLMFIAPTNLSQAAPVNKVAAAATPALSAQSGPEQFAKASLEFSGLDVAAID